MYAHVPSIERHAQLNKDMRAAFAIWLHTPCDSKVEGLAYALYKELQAMLDLDTHDKEE